MGYHQLKADIEKLGSEIEVLSSDWTTERDKEIGAQFRMLDISEVVARKKVAMKEKELEVAQLDLEEL